MKIEVAKKSSTDCAVQKIGEVPNGSWVRLVIAVTFARMVRLSESNGSWVCDAPA